MKKNKNHEQAPPDFRNNPFKSLKGIAVHRAAVPHHKPAVPKAGKNTPTPEQEADLFLRAAAGARKFEENKTAAAAPARKEVNPIKVASQTEEEDRLFLETMKSMGPNFCTVARDMDQEEARRTTSSRMRQLKRGTIRISQELDLHGYIKEEALKRLEHFIAAACSQAREAVLVITGKGANSPEGPVLQGAVDAWLRGKGKSMVAEFSPAPRDKGGSGAVVVFLKRKK